MSISKNEARRLAKNGLDAGARVLRGKLTLGSDGIKVDGRDISDWLADHDGAELILIAAPIGRPSAADDYVRTCYTCGRDFTGTTCPHCARVRARLRGS